MNPVKMNQIEEALRLTLAFVESFNKHDPARIGAIISEDCVFETAAPAPSGVRHVGRAAIARAIGAFFEATPDLEMIVEDAYGIGKRAVLRWKLMGLAVSPEGRRGVDLFTVQGGQIVEILAYAKG